MPEINLRTDGGQYQPPQRTVITIENGKKTEQIFENGKLKQVNVSIDRNGDGKFDSNELFYVDHYKEENGGTRVSRSIDNDFNGRADKTEVYKFDSNGNLKEKGDALPVYHHVMMNDVKAGMDGTSWRLHSEMIRVPDRFRD